MKNLKLFFVVTLLLQIKLGHAQATLTDPLGGGSLLSNTSVSFYKSPYLYHAENGTLYRYNTNTFTDSVTSYNGMTVFAEGLGSTVIGNVAYILQGNNFYKIDLNNFSRTNLQSYSSIYTRGKGALVYDGNNYIYFFGGMTITGSTSGPIITSSNELWRYDISLNSWFLLSTSPSRMSFQSGIYMYPYVYFGGGGSSVFFRFNLINNTWGTINNPSVTSAVAFFEEKGQVYGIDDAAFPNGVKLIKYDFTNDTWNNLSIDQQNWALFNNGSSGGITWASCKFGKVIPTGNSNFLLIKDGSLYNGCVSSFYNCNNCGNQNIHNLFSLSLKRQEHIIVDSTECFNSTMDSLMIYYRLQFTGSFSSSNNYVDRIDGANSINIKNFNNFFSTGTQILSFQKLIPSSALNSSVRGLNIQNSDSVYSNLYPISKVLRYSPTGTITANSSLTFCSGQPIGSVLTVTNSTGNSYQWYYNNSILTNQNSINYTATQLGNYYCQIKSTNGCSYNTTAVSIQTVTSPIATINAASSTTFCQGSSVILNANSGPGLTYQWKNNGTNISGATASSYTATTAGSYAVVVTNSVGCSLTSTIVSVTVNATPTVAVNNATICSGSTTNLTATGATTYSWSTGATTSSISVTPTANSNYTVIGTTNGCTNTKTVSVTVKATPTVAVSNATICSGSFANLTATGATTYSWNTGATTSSISVTPTANSNYTVTGTTNGCTNTKTVSVFVKATPTVAVSNATICSGNSANLAATGATTYSWSTGATTSSISVTPTVNSNYTVTGTTNGCTNTKTVSVTVKATPTVAVSNATICSGNSANLAATGATTYSWSTGATTSSISVTPTVNSNYTLTGTTNGCTNAKTVSVTVKATPTVAVSNATICSGSSANLTATGATTYSWSTGATSSSIAVTPTATINYTVTGTTNGCTDTKTVNVLVNNLPQLTVNSATICSGATATLTALGASTYTWDTGLVSPSLTDSPTINTTYTVTGTSLAGCINTATASIIIGSAPSISVNSNAICSGSSIVLTANGVSTYTWNTGANTSTIVVSPNITTTYTVSGYLVGCSVQTSNTATVTVNPLPTVSLNTIQSPLCVNNPTVQLSGSPTGGIYSGTGVSGSSFDPAVSGAGTFTINYSYNDANSCSATASQSINVNLCTGIAELDSESVFISPNPASTVINVKMNTTLINNAEIELYDATGKLITQQKVLNENTLLNINDLANGIYTVRVITNNEQIVKRIIKQL